MSVGSRSEKFNIVSSDHERTQKCGFCASVCKTNLINYHTPDTINGFRDSVLVCKMHDCYCTVRKSFGHFHSSPSSDASYFNGYTIWMKTNHFKMLLSVFSTTYTHSDCILIIVLLKNNLTNICSKISKIGIMNLWMIYTCNIKTSIKYERWEEGECTLHRWPKSWEICGCTRPF